jgi:hypothetical protein
MYKTYKKPLVHICNASLSLGIFPNRLKTAKVIPLYKKWDIHYVKNYRPIAIFQNTREMNV